MSYDLHKKYGDMRLLDTPICGEQCLIYIAQRSLHLEPAQLHMQSPSVRHACLTALWPHYRERLHGNGHWGGYDRAQGHH